MVHNLAIIVPLECCLLLLPVGYYFCSFFTNPQVLNCLEGAASFLPPAVSHCFSLPQKHGGIDFDVVHTSCFVRIKFKNIKAHNH